jgi:predicted MFS family arabinose efflux permease
MAIADSQIYAPGHASGRQAGSVAVALGGLIALASAMGIGRFVYTPILPPMAEALALSKVQAGLIASANFAGYLVGALLAAIHLPGGRRTWFVGSLALGAATTIAMAVPSAMPAFLLLRFAGGIASAFVLVIGSALVLDRLASSGRPGLAALHFAGVGVGIVVSALVVDVLQAAGFGWRALWLATGVAGAMAVPLAVWLIPGERADAVPQSSVEGSGRMRGVGALALCHGLFGFGYVITATFLVAVVRTAPHAQVLEAIVWPLVGVAAACSTMIWGRLGARFGALRLYGPACLVEAVGVAAGGVWPTPAGAVLAAVLLGGTFMGITAFGFGAARVLAPTQQRRAFALITAAFGVGQIIGPMFAGMLLDRTGGFAAPSLVAVAALVVGAGVAMVSARRYAS